MAPILKRLEKKILALWKNPDVEASYTGLANFQKYLKEKEKIDVSQSELYKIMRQQDSYVQSIINRKRFKRRRMYVQVS